MKDWSTTSSSQKKRQLILFLEGFLEECGVEAFGTEEYI